jgi:hypothetical protein
MRFLHQFFLLTKDNLAKINWQESKKNAIAIKMNQYNTYLSHFP